MINSSVYSVHDSRITFHYNMSERYHLFIGTMTDQTGNFVVAFIVLSVVLISIVHLRASDFVVHLLCRSFVRYDILTVLIIHCISVGIYMISLTAD